MNSRNKIPYLIRNFETPEEVANEYFKTKQ